MVFIDNILVYSKTREGYATQLRVVLQTLREHQLFAKWEKCEFWMIEMKFLGHLVSQEGISVDLANVDAILQWERPKNVMEIHSFLRLAGCYRHFIKSFSKIVTPLTKLTRKDVKFD